MLVEDLRKMDKYGAFSEYLSMVEAKKLGRIPEEYHDIFNDNCECGSERMISSELTKFMCCDPRCPIKLGYNLDYVFSKFNCENIGEKTCLSIMKHAYKYIDYKSHISVLDLEDKYFPSNLIGMPLFYFKQAINKVKGQALSFPDMVSRLGIPKFDSTALRVFGDIPSVDTLVDLIEKDGGVRQFLIKRNVYDAMKAFYLEEFLPDIAIAQYKVFSKIVPIGMVNIPVVLTGILHIDGIRITKDQFVSLCNDVGQVSPNVRLFNVQKSTAVESASFFIADYESTTAKFLTARRRQESEGRKLIYRPKEFIEMLKGQAEAYMEANGLVKPNETESSVSEMEVFE